MKKNYSESNEEKEERRFQIALYVSKDEKERIKEKSKKNGMKISQYIRFKVLSDL